jgi:hypothetical protein
MNDEEDLVERQKEIDAIQARYATRADGVRPSYGARILAILLLSFVAPFLLFLAQLAQLEASFGIPSQVAMNQIKELGPRKCLFGRVVATKGLDVAR